MADTTNLPGSDRKLLAVMPRRPEHWGRGHFPTVGEGSNFTEYSILNKYMHAYLVMLIDVLAQTCYHVDAEFFHIIVGKIAKFQMDFNQLVDFFS